MQLTLDQFQKGTGSSRFDAQRFYEPVVASMERFEITEVSAVCAFLAHVAIESNRLQQVEESLYYRDPERLVKLYLRVFDANHNRRADPDEIEHAKTYVKNHAGLSQLLYQGYHGRGLIQLTWLANYQAASDALGYDYVSNPHWLTTPEHAALSAAWFFSSRGCVAVADDIEASTRIINPALMHLAERRAQFEQNVEMLA